MPLSSVDESHGLRRESHPTRVAFLLPPNIFSGVQSESQSLRTLIALCCGSGARGRAADLKISTSAHHPRKKNRRSSAPSGFLTRSSQSDFRAIRSGGHAPASSCHPAFVRSVFRSSGPSRDLRSPVAARDLFAWLQLLLSSVPLRGMNSRIGCPSSPCRSDSETSSFSVGSSVFSSTLLLHCLASIDHPFLLL